VKAVIFDFSGTLFHCGEARNWLSDTLTNAGIEASDAEIDFYARRLRNSGGQPGGHGGDIPLPEHLRPLWERRDLDPPAHHEVYTELMRDAALPWPGIEDTLYEQHWRCWEPYPDTRQVLELLKRREIPTVVLSNIPRDIRPVFDRYGLNPLITGYVLSFEQGVRKPDPEIFRRACEVLGQDPADVLMVGDNVVEDGAAAAVGCEFHAVAHLPVTQRPSALLQAIAG
jgi:HAD superfamily hydrolase (TIGR01493 family)